MKQTNMPFCDKRDVHMMDCWWHFIPTCMFFR